jgi:hypothetical protein
LPVVPERAVQDAASGTAGDRDMRFAVDGRLTGDDRSAVAVNGKSSGDVVGPSKIGDDETAVANVTSRSPSAAWTMPT